MGTLADLLKDSRFWKDSAQGLTDSVNRGAVAGLLGGPVDAVSGVVNAGLMGLGYAGNKLGLLSADRMPQPIQKPVGGSEWIGDLLQRGGMVSENRNAPAEMLAGLLAPSAVKGASKAAFVAENNAMAPTPYNTAAMGQLGAISPQGKVQLESLRDAYKAKGVELDAYPLSSKDQINLSRLVVDKKSRNQGNGTNAMNDLVRVADENGQVVTLTPSTDFGASSVNRLREFYKRFGFVDNKGKNKDFAISESMYRPIKKE